MERNQMSEGRRQLDGKQVKLAWMYPDIMDLYGDKGNIMALEKRARMYGINLLVDRISIGQDVDLREYDLIFIGGGADKEQRVMMPDLLARKENIRQAIEEGSFCLLICGGYQFFGQYYQDANDEKLEGLGLYPYYTEAVQDHRRCIGNIVIRTTLDGYPFTLIGFENHGGQTRNVSTPLGEVLFGFGNNFEDHLEGFYDGKVLGTYLHGPLLPKNSRLSDFILYKGLLHQDPGVRFEDFGGKPFPFEAEARNTLFERFHIDDQYRN